MEFKEGKRVDLCYEGLATRDGRRVEPGALRFWDDYVPVTARDGGHLNEVVGRASAFERREVEEGRNVVSAVVELRAGLMYEVDAVNRHVELTDVDMREEGDLYVVTGAVLRGIFLSRGPGGWPTLDVAREAPGAPADPRPRVPDGGPDLAWAVEYAEHYWTFGQSAETQAALHVLKAHATADVGEATVEHMEDPLLVDLDDESVEWLIDAARHHTPGGMGHVSSALGDALAKRREG
jgi:hypothetical protein